MTGFHQPTAAPSTVRLLIADDHAVVREGLRALIEAQPGLTVIGEAADGDEAWRKACDLKPDVLLLDLSMPRGAGVGAVERIARDCPEVRIVVLTMHEERGYVTHALRAGAKGYVLKRTAAAELVRAVRTVVAGGTYVDPSLAGALLAEPPRGVAAEGAAQLTPREAEVLRLVARGYSNKEIAEALHLSVKTIETHKANGMMRLGLVGRAALVRFALEASWLSDET